MEQENFDYHKSQLERRGWEHLVPQLEEKMKSGEPEFSLLTEGEIEGEKVGYELTFRKHPEHDHYFFNHIIASLNRDGEELKASFKESWKLSPEEMYRITAYGSKVAVYKEGILNKAKERFNAYITVNADEPLNEKGELNINTYHDKYYQNHPFDIEDELTKIAKSVNGITPENLKEIKEELISGVFVPVILPTEDGEIEVYLTLNAKRGKVECVDTDLEPVDLLEQGEKQKQKTEKVTEPSKETESQDIQESKSQGNEKKKPWENRVTPKWNKAKQGKAVR
ncbi:hypothetical protein FXV77_05195 [Sphingobacterium phlebotomi]|uniref:Uncharacterized protein n=1 Tax=Sphingobacterium phlebotomi TaxID=2605433 RepID=A0A5D4HB23_9SPHI|nr:hypothetical protein [Sphingobacterium phlebotomi]TYR37403.1 hypothetical protein FXV77_05195 [Sphingobacterium phlebotomi]